MLELPDNRKLGKPCRKCGGTVKYASTRKCVPCRQARAREFQVRHYHTHGSYLYSRLGITRADFDIMREAQDWKCKICGTIPESTMHLDHCHQTMKIRGLLCGPCNKGLGLFRDNPEILEAAAEYLRQC